MLLICKGSRCYEVESWCQGSQTPPAPSPPYSGERAGVRGRSARSATRRIYASRPSPQPSPEYGGEGAGTVALMPMRHRRAAKLAIHFFPFDRLALIVLLLSLGDPDLHFCPPAFEIDRQRNQRRRFLLGFRGQAFDLATMGQQLAVALGLMVIDQGRLLVRIDVGAVENQLTIFDAGPGILQLGFAGPERFHFAADQHDPAFDLATDKIIVQRPAIVDAGLEVFFTLASHVHPRHRPIGRRKYSKPGRVGTVGPKSASCLRHDRG